MEWIINDDAKIIFVEQSKRFAVFYGEENTSNNVYASYDEAVCYIESRREREERANRTKISVPVIDAKGIRHVITGIHGGHGGYTAKPPVDKYVTTLYLDHPRVVRILNELRDAERVVEALHDKLKSYNLTTSDWQRRRDHLDTTEGIKNWCEKKTAEAEGLS